MAEVEAAVNSSTLVLELAPVFCAMTPVKSVSELRSLESFENNVPRVDSSVSWLCRDANWFFQGVSTFFKLPTIWETVALTSKPAPLVGDPKLSPTVPIAASVKLQAVCEPTGPDEDGKSLTAVVESGPAQ